MSRLERIVLVGFMGSGKTTVGRRLAAALDWRFMDLDDAVSAECGMSVRDIFATRGEAHFREVEERVARRWLEERGIVLATGGGWAAMPGRLDETPPGTETFWLRVSAKEALHRTAREPGRRPLLAGPDPAGEAARLLSAREPFYRRAAFTVDTEHRSAEDVTAGILEILADTYPEALQNGS